MNGVRRISGVFLLLFLAACGPSTFLLNRDGDSAYFGRESGSLHRLLCEQGDLKLILQETSMPANIQNELYRNDCAADRSVEKVISLYLLLSLREKLELQRAFKRHGFRINYLSC